MSDKVQQLLAAASSKVSQLERQRAELVATQIKSSQELETVLDEAKATAALARARVAGNKLTLVERDLSLAQQEVVDLQRRILLNEIADLEQQLTLGREAMVAALALAQDEAQTYAALSLQLTSLQQRAGDVRYQTTDQLGFAIARNVGDSLLRLGWQATVGEDNVRRVVAPAAVANGKG